MWLLVASGLMVAAFQVEQDCKGIADRMYDAICIPVRAEQCATDYECEVSSVPAFGANQNWVIPSLPR